MGRISMHTVKRALTAGIASTAVMSIILLVIDVQTRARLSLFEAIARLFGLYGHIGWGLLVFLFFGVVVWPILFAKIYPSLPPERDLAVKGMVLATGLWIGFVLIGTAKVDAILVLFYLVVTLLPHLVYGFVLGVVYGWTGPTQTPDMTNSQA